MKRFDYEGFDIYLHDESSEMRVVIMTTNKVNFRKQCLFWINRDDTNNDYTLYKCYDEGKFSKLFGTVDHDNGSTKRLPIVGIDEI